MDFEKTESILRALGEQNRLKILTYLSLETLCVCELVEILDISQPQVSQHLRKLREAELVTEEKRGRWVYYSLNNAHPLYSLVLHIISTLPSVQLKETRAICK